MISLTGYSSASQGAASHAGLAGLAEEQIFRYEVSRVKDPLPEVATMSR